jgi:hypothetical protein
MLQVDRIEQLATPDDVVRAGFGRNPVYARVRLYEHDGKRIAIVTQLFRNPGPSITTAAEIVYSTIQSRHNVDLLIEHYPLEPETFDLVRIVDDAATWSRLEPTDLPRMIGETLAPHAYADEPAWLELAGTAAPPTLEERSEEALGAIVDEQRERAFCDSIRNLRSSRKEYRGIFDDRKECRIIVVDENGGRPLTHYIQHSPSGFAWGYYGSGPADAARCILADALGLHPIGDAAYVPWPYDASSIPEIERLYQRFKSQIVATLPQAHEWVLPLSRVEEFLAVNPPRRTCPRHREPLDEYGCAGCAEEAIAAAEGPS